jgi:2-aminomuconate deaminase
VIENIGVILEAAGAGLEHVVDITVFLVDMKDYPGMNEVYNEYFEAQTGPSRTTVAVHQLPHPNLLIEMKAVAMAPQ